MTTFNLNDYGFSAKALELEYGKQGTGEHPNYTRAMWQDSLSQTPRSKYWNWVEAQLDDELASLNEEVSDLGLGLAL